MNPNTSAGSASAADPTTPKEPPTDSAPILTPDTPPAPASRPTVLVTVDTSDGLLPEVSVGLQFRALTASGWCPGCDVRVERPNREARRAAEREGRDVRVTAHHDQGCPAIAPAVLDHVRRSTR